ncbi:sesquipedalian-1-like [Spea bombifrons]|uniref:sesquipedalian-1-like n=1 Tax=Spea bombifrons TaxID=233779 RepID=UPI00234BF49C|nr:sesquipedalian-1-like [Spea bombifrons]
MKLKVSQRLTLSLPQKEGYLLKRGGRHASYHRRWFQLCGNLLLYWERQEDPQPLGLILLEGSTVYLRATRLEFGFCLCTVSRVYKMAAECQQELEQWVRALLSANLGYTKAILEELRGQYLSLAAGQKEPHNASSPERPSEERVWKETFGVLHQFLGEEILALRQPKPICL